MRLAQQNILTGQHLHYHKWPRYYLDFCHKYSFASTDRQSLPAFQNKLRAKCKPSIPVVLSREEVDRIATWLDAPYALVASLLYGCGLQLFERLKLRVQDLNFAMMILTV